MKILDELEHQLVTDWNLLLEMDPEGVCECATLSASGVLAEKALPTLIRVARAAEAMQEIVAAHLALDQEECWRDLHSTERALNKALQELRNLNAAEMSALQQEMGLDD